MVDQDLKGPRNENGEWFYRGDGHQAKLLDVSIPMAGVSSRTAFLPKGTKASSPSKNVSSGHVT
jgi:hypothetical protein